MKRSISGGTRRGAPALARQRRTMRLMQALLVLLAAGLLVFAGYSVGRRSGYDAGKRARALETPRRPAVAQTVVLVMLGAGALGAAVLLGSGGDVRIPTPARLDELSGRAEAAAVAKAEHVSS